MITKIECIYYAQIALIRLIEQNKSVEPYSLYKEMCKLLNI